MKKLLLLSVFLLSACVYHPPVYQGNILTQKNMAAIHTGMSAKEVMDKLGSPVLKDIYADSRITYVYETKMPRQDMKVKRMTVDFQNDRVVNVREF